MSVYPNLSDWQMFKKQAPRLPLSALCQVLDRSELDLPAWFLPLARGAAIASSHVLRSAGWAPGSRQPAGWRCTNTDFFTRRAGLVTLVVRGCGELWTIENWCGARRCEDADQVLVLDFGFTPIFAGEADAAMHLADYCYSRERPDGLCWVEAAPFDYKGEIRTAS